MFWGRHGFDVDEEARDALRETSFDHVNLNGTKTKRRRLLLRSRCLSSERPTFL